jgi:single-strand DNA-binding protein
MCRAKIKGGFMDTNVVILIGRMTKDIETRAVGEHTAGAFTLAVNGFKKDEVSFIDCKCWNKIADTLSKYTAKGSKISVVGQLKQDTWEKDGSKHSKIVVNVKEFQFLDSKKEGAQTAPEPYSSIQGTFNGSKADFTENPFSDDDVPF